MLMCVGKQAKLIAEAAILAGFPENAVQRFEDAKSAATAFPDTLREGDLVLLKASRGIRLEEVAIAIAKRAAEAARKAAS